MAKATLILHRKRTFDDGTISEMKLWMTSDPVAGSNHPFKYSLFLGRSGERWIGYDNERGKGDHRHRGDVQDRYEFSTPEQLVKDFLADVRDERRRRLREVLEP